VAAQVLSQVPGATLAHDSAGRLTDIAIDHSEFHHLDGDAIAQVVALMQRRRHDGHGQLDPRQRLVRRPRQVVGRAVDAAAVVRA
jgi:hypothetical protein